MGCSGLQQTCTYDDYDCRVRADDFDWRVWAGDLVEDLVHTSGALPAGGTFEERKIGLCRARPKIRDILLRNACRTRSATS